MSGQEIENLLRKAPRVNVPAGLVDKLQDAILLPQPRFARAEFSAWRLWLRRWIPAAACLAVAGVVAATQFQAAEKLRQENGALRPSGQNLDSLRRKNVEYQQLLAENKELNRLRKDQLELESLRNEVAQLQVRMQEAETLRAENQKLRLQISVVSSGQAGTDVFDVAETTKAKAQSIRCVNNLKNIGLATRIYASDNNDYFPTSFLQMSNELSTPLILICPSDLTGTDRGQAGWAAFRPDMTSYQFYLTGDKDEAVPQRIIAKCPIHGHVCLADGSVHQNPEGRAFKEAVVNGRLVLVPNNAPDPRPGVNTFQ